MTQKNLFYRSFVAPWNKTFPFLGSTVTATITLRLPIHVARHCYSKPLFLATINIHGIFLENQMLNHNLVMKSAMH